MRKTNDGGIADNLDIGVDVVPKRGYNTPTPGSSRP